jgi:hypothetical protein
MTAKPCRSFLAQVIGDNDLFDQTGRQLFASRVRGMSESVDRLVFMVYMENGELRPSFFMQLKSPLDSN